MALIENDFESGSNGTTLSTSNTSSPDPIAAAPTETSGTVKFSSTQAQKGSLAMRLLRTNTSGTCAARWNVSSANDCAFRCYLYVASRPSTSGMGLLTFTSSTITNRYVSFVMTNTGVIALFNYAGGYDSPNGASSFSTTAISTGTWYRLEITVDNGNSSTGAADVRMYSGDGTTAISGLSFTTSSRNYGSGAFANVWLGTANSGTPPANGTPDIYYDDMAFETGTLTFLGPSSSAIPGDVTSPVATVSTSAVSPTISTETVVSGAGPATVSAAALPPTVTGSDPTISAALTGAVATSTSMSRDASIWAECI